MEQGMSTTPSSMHAEAALNRRLVLFASQLETYIAHFPNCHKYALTQTIRQTFVDVYCLTVEAQKRFHKKTALGALDVKHEQMRMLINLAHELGLFSHQRGQGSDPEKGQHRFLALSRQWDEIGRMVGGWIGKESRGNTGESGGPQAASAVGD
jgi:hypothetical protein